MRARVLAALLLALPDPEAEVDLTGAFGKIQPLTDVEFVTDAAFGRVQLRVAQRPRVAGSTVMNHWDEQPIRPGCRTLAEVLAASERLQAPSPAPGPAAGARPRSLRDLERLVSKPR